MITLEKNYSALIKWRLWIIPSAISLILMLIVQNSFSTFYALIECCIVIISFLIFTLAWTTKKYTKNSFLIFIACGYLWIGALDLMHILYFMGKKHTIEGNSAGIQFNLVARYFESLILLAAPFPLIRKQNAYLLVTLFGCLVVGLSNIIIQGHFPLSFVEGTGVTDFHIYSQFIILFILSAALFTYYSRNLRISTKVKQLVMASIVMCICAEFAYVFYSSQFLNLFSHICKLFSFWLIFNAVIDSNLKTPYTELRKNKDNFKRLFENSEVSIWNQDLSEVIHVLNKLRDDGVTDINNYLNKNKDSVLNLIKMVKVHQVNEATLKLFVAKDYDEINNRIHETFTDDSVAAFKNGLCAIWAGEQAFRSESKYRTLDGREISCIISFQIPENIEYFSSIPVSLVDITHRKKDEERIWRQGNFDDLTGLVNRNLFSDRLSHALDISKRHESTLALIYLDLDGFKHVNDTQGHLVGDKLLQEASIRLLSHMRESDTVARLGGDEFAIILPDITSYADIERIVKKIQDNLALPYNLEGHVSFVSASIGVTIFPEDGNDTVTLLRKADSAMYKAKRKGRNNFQFFTAEIDKEAMDRKELEEAMYLAFENEDFVLNYQPVINLTNGKIESAEALLRWNHPEKGVIDPSEFISLAEEIGLIIPLGEWVLRKACSDALTWSVEGNYAPTVAVNFSSLQFQSQDTAQLIEAILLETGLPANRLIIEITEGLLLADNELVLSQLQKIRCLGVSLSIDDFGTGYSSLSYLKRFPVNTLKIDRSFISNLPYSLEDAALVNAILSIADNLGLTVVAEGVETELQAEFIKSTNCQYLQGFLYSKALSNVDLKNYFEFFSKKVCNENEFANEDLLVETS